MPQRFSLPECLFLGKSMMMFRYSVHYGDTYENTFWYVRPAESARLTICRVRWVREAGPQQYPGGPFCF